MEYISEVHSLSEKGNERGPKSISMRQHTAVIHIGQPQSPADNNYMQWTLRGSKSLTQFYIYKNDDSMIIFGHDHLFH